MPANIVGKKLPDTYFDLVKQFPLVHIKDDDELGAAQKMINELLQRDLDEGAQAYFDVLTDLVGSYEDENVLIPDASETDVLRELMAANGLSQRRLAKEVGISSSTISAVLSRAQSFTDEQTVKVAKFFHVSPAVFAPHDQVRRSFLIRRASTIRSTMVTRLALGRLGRGNDFRGRTLLGRHYRVLVSVNRSITGSQ